MNHSKLNGQLGLMVVGWEPSVQRHRVQLCNGGGIGSGCDHIFLSVPPHKVA